MIALRAALWPLAPKDERARDAVALLDKEPAAAAFFVHDTEGAAIAFAEVTLRTDFVNGCSTSPAGFLEGIYVRSNWHRHGAARLLCLAVEAWPARSAIGDKASQHMHEALGSTETWRFVSYCKRLGASSHADRAPSARA